MKSYLRERGNRFLQDGDDTPNHDGDADDAVDAPQQRKGGHDSTGEPGAGRLWELDSSSILNLKTKKSKFKFIIYKFNFPEKGKGVPCNKIHGVTNHFVT